MTDHPLTHDHQATCPECIAANTPQARPPVPFPADHKYFPGPEVTRDGRRIWRVTSNLAVELDAWYEGQILVHAGRNGGTKAVIDPPDVTRLIEALHAAVRVLDGDT